MSGTDSGRRTADVERAGFDVCERLCNRANHSGHRRPVYCDMKTIRLDNGRVNALHERAFIPFSLMRMNERMQPLGSHEGAEKDQSPESVFSQMPEHRFA